MNLSPLSTKHSILAQHLAERYEGSQLHLDVILAPDHEALEAAKSRLLRMIGAVKYKAFKDDVRDAAVGLELIREFGPEQAEMIAAACGTAEAVLQVLARVQRRAA